MGRQCRIWIAVKFLRTGLGEVSVLCPDITNLLDGVHLKDSVF